VAGRPVTRPTAVGESDVPGVACHTASTPAAGAVGAPPAPALTFVEIPCRPYGPADFATRLRAGRERLAGATVPLGNADHRPGHRSNETPAAKAREKAGKAPFGNFPEGHKVTPATRSGPPSGCPASIRSHSEVGRLGCMNRWKPRMRKKFRRPPGPSSFVGPVAFTGGIDANAGGPPADSHTADPAMPSRRHVARVNSGNPTPVPLSSHP